MLLRGPQVMPPTPPSPPLCLLAPAAYHPYALPAQHASDAAYHPYTYIVPAQYAFNTSYHPYTFSALPTCLRRPPHTGLILNPAYDPYAPAAPSR
ncbi:hypothetical protein O181_061852 [Austropuccinia psidii MF-1]|uniref:Uncharacterized protein n=1 Tax=Austropuccinia psidii MF-1 TaxID=1389203 RepID=A0A9Q3ER92_9BASI|nr:hypothetical protein [Austropuccinia psidii MF-1]